MAKLMDVTLVLTKRRKVFERDGVPDGEAWSAVIPSDVPGMAGVGVSIVVDPGRSEGERVFCSEAYLNNRVRNGKKGGGKEYYLTVQVPQAAEVRWMAPQEGRRHL